MLGKITWCVDPALIQHLQPHLGVVGADVDSSVDPIRRAPLYELFLRCRRDRSPAGAEPADRLCRRRPTSRSPSTSSTCGTRSRYLRGRTAGEEVRGLGPVRVGIDDELIV